jgi:hypothetical protein
MKWPSTDFFNINLLFLLLILSALFLPVFHLIYLFLFPSFIILILQSCFCDFFCFFRSLSLVVFTFLLSPFFSSSFRFSSFCLFYISYLTLFIFLLFYISSFSPFIFPFLLCFIFRLFISCILFLFLIFLLSLFHISFVCHSSFRSLSLLLQVGTREEPTGMSVHSSELPADCTVCHTWCCQLLSDPWATGPVLHLCVCCNLLSLVFHRHSTLGGFPGHARNVHLNLVSLRRQLTHCPTHPVAQGIS